MKSLRILVATDLDAPASRVVEQAMRFAPAGSMVTVMHAYQRPPEGMPKGRSIATSETIAAMEKDAERKIAELAGAHTRTDVKMHAILRCGDSAEEILAVAEELEAHLVVVGTHGRTGAERLLLGSVAESVIRKSPRAVLVVR